MTKACFKCHETKELTEFYRHPQMADGHLNKCKECAKADVRQHRIDNPEKLSEYERTRYQRPIRKAEVQRNLKALRKRCPEKARAWAMVGRAKRTGRLVPQPCEVCGTTIKVQAHHEDYSKPLDVRWLCFTHHREDGHGHVVVKRSA